MPLRLPRLLLRLLVPVLSLPGGMSAAGVAGPAAAPHTPAEYSLREWHEQDGLPSEELTAVVQDAQGYLWVASGAGLARFDGGAFESADLPPGGYHRGLARLADGLAGALALPGNPPGPDRGAGLYLFGESGFHFQPEPALSDRTPQTLLATPDGSRWIGCEDGTVLRRQGAATTVLAAPADLDNRRPTALATDAAGRVWILRGNRLWRLDGAEPVEIAFAGREPELRIASSATGGVWVFTRTALLRWGDDGFREVLRLPELRGAHFVQTALEDSHGYLWVGTRSQGLHRIIGQDILRVPTSSENIVALCEDREGNLWAATNGGGLCRLRAKAHRLLDQGSGLKDNFSYTVAEDTAGTVWLANRDGGMVRFADNAIDPIATRAGWRAFSAMSVFPSADGKVWMTGGLGVFRTEAAAPETLSRISALGHLRNIRATFVTHNGDYWLAVDPDRVGRWRDGVLTTFGPEEGFDGREVRAFAEDATGRIWLGAADGRLFRTREARLERVLSPNAENCGALQVLRFEPDGTMLLGTTRRGVIIFPRGDLAHPLALDSYHGLPGNNITQILNDDHDRTWFASRTGVFWVHGSHLRDFAAGRVDSVHSISLGKDDDLPYLSCLGLFQPAAWKARDGTLWFATRRGMLRTDPTLVNAGPATPPPVTIASLTCDGRPQPAAPTLRIGFGVRKTQLRLSVLNLSAPESVQVRYRLDGFDPEWLILDQSRLVTYPRLPPGRYVLSTLSSNGSGAWHSQPGLLTIDVVPSWWQEPWAQAGGILLLVALVGAAVRAWSHRRLRRKLARSESARLVEQERTRIARNIHDDLGASLTRISLLTQAAQQESTVHSPTLQKIYEATRAITRSLDEIVWAVNPQQDNIESLVYYLGNFASSLLGAAGVRCRLESPTLLPDTPLPSQLRHHLFLGCKEALHNVAKHARATEVLIRISAGAGTLAIAIADNGCGLGATDRAAPDPLRAAPGHGLGNLRQRMAEIGGTCTFSASPEGGTTVTFTIPLVQPHAD